MKKNILLTGKPGAGKTTVIQKVLSRLHPGSVTGFYTEEVREGGVRQGFAIMTLAGEKATLSHVGFKSKPSVGKYGVSLEAIDRFIVPSIQGKEDEARIIVIDEIGKMECLSPKFRAAVTSALDRPCSVLGTIAARGQGFINSIKKRGDVSLVEVTPSTRDNLPDLILATLKSRLG